MLDFKQLEKISKEREKCQNELKKLKNEKLELENKIKNIYPLNTLPTYFNSEYGGYQTNELIEASLSLKNLPKGVPCEVECNCNYEAEMNNGILKCKLKPKHKKTQKKLLKIEKEIAGLEAKIVELNSFEEYLLNQQRTCDLNLNTTNRG